MDIPSETLLTPGETARLLRCSLRTLDRERAEGRGCPFVRIGGRIRYRRADIESFIVAHLRGDPGEPVPTPPTPRGRRRGPPRKVLSGSQAQQRRPA
jgi:excisionase family DNA binding protein